jgi:imidazolonepropionase-like amidohydrolase
VASTRALSAPGGQFGGLTPEAQKLIEQEYMAISGVEEARRAVRQAFYDGADCIKVIVDTGPRMLSLEEMNVVVDEAHRVKKKVAAHVAGDQAARIAAEAGVDSIEHAYNVPDDVLKIMAEKHIAARHGGPDWLDRGRQVRRPDRRTRQPPRRYRCARARELRDEGGCRRASSVNRPLGVPAGRRAIGSPTTSA